MTTEPKPESPAELAAEIERLASDFATVYGRLHFARQCGGPITKAGEETESARASLYAAIEKLAAIATIQASASASPGMEWWRLNPPVLELGRTYTTRDGRSVTMVELANPGKEYESMADQNGHHRYSRSHSRIVGRLTGSSTDDPGNIVFAAPPTAATQARPVSGEAWRPIAEAPKDGTAILVICDKALRPAPAVAHWSDTDGRGWLGGCASDWLDDVDAAEQMYGYFPNATRWARIAPLPAAPTSTPSAAKKD